MVRRFLFVLVCLVSSFAAMPTVYAHAAVFTPQGTWTIAFVGQPDAKYAPNQLIYLSGFASFASESPSAGAVTRTYDFVFPESFRISNAMVGFTLCSILGNIAHCEVSGDVKPGLVEGFSIEVTPTTIGDYSGSVSSTARLPGGAAPSGNDDFAFDVENQGSADIFWSKMPSHSTKLTSGKPASLDYVLKNNGPDDARDVSVNFSIDETTFPAGWGVEPSDRCMADSVGANCTIPLIEVGKTVEITLIRNQGANQGVQSSTIDVRSIAIAFDSDPKFENNATGLEFDTRCNSFVHPTASVERKAKVANKGCTYIGANVVVQQKAHLAAGAAVTGNALLEAGASVGAKSLFAGDSDTEHGVMRRNSSLGSSTRFLGELGERARVGNNVLLDGTTTAWVVLQENARIGNGVRFEQTDSPPVLTVFAGKMIPNNAIVSRAFCEAHPAICSVSPAQTGT